jgi:hypothetical protein
MYNPLTPFNPWMLTNPTLPKLYWEVKSPEQLIANLYCIIEALRGHIDEADAQVNANSKAIAELQELMHKFMESGFEDYYAAQIEQWINDNLLQLWDTFADMVFFGLTSDGRFCAYVPDSWADITFDTGAVYGTDSYGRLLLKYNTSGRGVIDNTAPNYGIKDPSADIAKLQSEIRELQHTVYTSLTERG